MNALTFAAVLVLACGPLPQAAPAVAPVPSTLPSAQAARLVEETVTSAALGRSMKYRVLLPTGYAGSLRRYPVLYLLHGLGGDYKDWTTRTNLAEYTRDLPLIVVMPDGENSWYVDAEPPEGGKFETYIGSDLVADVEQKYRAIRSRYGRAVAGLSMGGYGAIKLALKRPAQFAAAGSFSGAVSVTRDDGLARAVGQREENRIHAIFGTADSRMRRENDVYVLAAAAKPAAAPYLYLDCGTEDGLLQANRDLVAELKKAGLTYEYHEAPGAHAWDYWNRRIRALLDAVMPRLGR